MPHHLRLRLSVAAVTAAACTAAGCGDNGVQPSTPTITTLASSLEYPKAMWLADGSIYLTETAARNTTFGGALRLDRYDLAAGQLKLVLDHPTNSDALVAAADGRVYLASYVTSIPGNQGAVSVLDTATGVETPLIDLGIAPTDMFLDPTQDIYVLGASDDPAAPSLYRLAAPGYTDTTVVKRGLGRTGGLTRVGSTTYYSDPGGIQALDASGSVTPLSDEPASVTSLATDGSSLYATDLLAGLLVRIDLSTGAVDTLLTGLHSPLAVRIDGAGETLYLLQAGTTAGQFKDGTLAAVTGFR
jgi:sugar lactone lactonase YvrE